MCNYAKDFSSKKKPRKNIEKLKLRFSIHTTVLTCAVLYISDINVK